MRIGGPFEFAASRGSKALVSSPRRCEKTSSSSALNGYPQDGDDAGQSSIAVSALEFVSRDETFDFDPFWDGPRLLPTFVAQVMAQAMAKPERRDGAIVLETAYASIAFPRMALVLDRKS
jgi:hypothetical protein